MLTCLQWKTLKISDFFHQDLGEHLRPALKTSRPSLLARPLGVGRLLRKLVRVLAVERLVRHVAADAVEEVRVGLGQSAENLALGGGLGGGLAGGLAGDLAGELVLVERPSLEFAGFVACDPRQSGRRFPCTKHQHSHRPKLVSRPTKQVSE